MMVLAVEGMLHASVVAQRPRPFGDAWQGRQARRWGSPAFNLPTRSLQVEVMLSEAETAQCGVGTRESRSLRAPADKVAPDISRSWEQDPISQ